MKFNRLFLAIFGATLILDQLVKGLARAALNDGNFFANTERIGNLSPLPWPGVFELKLIYNRGVAFGMLEGKGHLMAPVGLLIAGFCLWYSGKMPARPRLPHVALALVASGAVGNLIDRVWKQKVTDMFWFRAIDFPVFNIADACISIGVVLLFLAGFMPGALPTEAPKEDPVEAPSESEFQPETTPDAPELQPLPENQREQS